MRFSCTAGADAIRPPGRERGRRRGGPVREVCGGRSAGGRRRGRLGGRLLAVEAPLVRGLTVAREAVRVGRRGGGGRRLVEVLRREVRPGDAGAEREQRPAG